MTRHSRYLIVGSSHAALEALAAIRQIDPEGTIGLVSRDTHPPYSPTILPYVVSGRAAPERVRLRGEGYFADNGVAVSWGSAVAAVEPALRRVRLADGSTWGYDKLLLATGAAPVIPPVEGLDRVRGHVLRSLDDALGLRQAMVTARSAVVLGAGLVGMHAAENLVKGGAAVTVIERLAQPLPGYFDRDAAGLIEGAFTAKGVRMLMGRAVAKVVAAGEGCLVTLDDGASIAADLLLIAAGVRPETGFLAGSGIALDRGILVDPLMRTSVAEIWAAGDVTQAKAFAGGSAVFGILPLAVEQGRIAGFDMAGDTAVKPYPGGIGLNTYSFFGEHAVSVGEAAAGAGEVDLRFDPAARRYRKLVLKDGRLVGAAAVNDGLDGGVMWQLILRGVDLTPHRQAFLERPLETGRMLMSRLWR